MLHDGVDLTPAEFEAFLEGQADLSPKAWPRHVWLTDALPATATNKVLKRELTALGSSPVGGRLWVRAARGTSYAEDDRRPAAGKRNDDRLV